MTGPSQNTRILYLLDFHTQMVFSNYWYFESNVKPNHIRYNYNVKQFIPHLVRSLTKCPPTITYNL